MSCTIELQPVNRTRTQARLKKPALYVAACEPLQVSGRGDVITVIFRLLRNCSHSAACAPLEEFRRSQLPSFFAPGSCCHHQLSGSPRPPVLDETGSLKNQPPLRPASTAGFHSDAGYVTAGDDFRGVNRLRMTETLGEGLVAF